jgi:Invasion associated locus B (IalB) protein
MKVFLVSILPGLLLPSPSNAALLPGSFYNAAIEGPAKLVTDAGQKERPSWTKLCFRVPTAKWRPAIRLPAGEENADACFTYTLIYVPLYKSAEPGAPVVGEALLGSVGVLQIQSTGRNFVAAIFPLDGNPPEPDIRIEGGARLKLDYPPPGCDAVGCFARAESSQTFLVEMKTAKALSFGALDVWGHYMSVQLQCCDFAAAFDAPPVPSEAQTSMQMKMRETIQWLSVHFVR